VKDTDQDGLPESIWCAGGAEVDLSSATGGMDCSGLVSLGSGDGCQFDIDVWIGTIGNDVGATFPTVLPVDCSGNGNPVLMFPGSGPMS